MNHAELVRIAERWLLRTRRCSFVLRELRSSHGEIPDCIGFKIYAPSNEGSVVVECKATKTDFLSDAKKSFRKNPEHGVGAYRFYLAPEGVITPEELPAKWGLVTVGKSGKPILRVGPRGDSWHENRNDFRFDDRNLQGEWSLMASAMRRVHLRGDIGKIYLPESAPESGVFRAEDGKTVIRLAEFAEATVKELEKSLVNPDNGWIQERQIHNEIVRLGDLVKQAQKIAEKMDR